MAKESLWLYIVGTLKSCWQSECSLRFGRKYVETDLMSPNAFRNQPASLLG